MIFIKPYFDKIPSKMTTEIYQLPLNAILEKKNRGEKLTESDFKDYAPKEVKDALKIIFNNKCAYCECKIDMGAHYDLEHFRPKTLYYWLAYEWTNFLLSCQICNRYCKNAKFPIKGKQVEKPPLSISNKLDNAECLILSKTLENEERLLLHPAIDDPKKHLRFLADGNIEELSEQGKKSIEIYGLNRDNLIDARKKIIFEERTVLNRKFLDPKISSKAIKECVHDAIYRLLYRMENAQNEPYIGFIITVLERFEEFIIEDNSDDTYILPHKEIMRQAAREALKG